MIITFVILGITIALFIYGKPRADVVALMSLLALVLSGILTAGQALAGFSDSTVLLIAALFVVSEGLSRTGVTAWLGNFLLRMAANSAARLLVVMMIGAAGLSAFISNTGTVATLLPTISAAAWRVGSVPSKFLMPLAYATNTGGLLTLTGTPPNIVVSDALRNAGFAPFGFFEFALIGLPLLFVTILYITTVGRRLLPRRNADQRPLELSQAVGEVASTFGLDERLYTLRIRARSSLVGKTLQEAALGRDYSVTVLRVDHNLAKDSDETTGLPAAKRLRRLGYQVRDQLEQLQPAADTPLPGPTTRIFSQDRLLVKGRQENVERLALDYQLGMQAVTGDGEALSAELLSSEIGIAEVLLAVRSQYIGRTLAEARFAEKYHVQVLGIWRGDKKLVKTTEPLKFGDALLVRGRWADIDLLRNEARNFVIVGSPEALSRQVVELTPRSAFAVIALVAMVVMMVTNIVPTVIAAFITAVAMVLAGCLNMDQGYRSISWQTVVLIAATIPLSTALEITGGAELIAGILVNTVGAIGPIALLAGVFLLTTAFSQVISNTATAVLVAPIVLTAAATLGVSPYPLMMGVAVAASNAFLTPIGTTTNLMVYTPGGYRFTDYFKVGAPLTLIFFILTLLLVPLIWPF
jgi:di/tricarboxylate transporter